MFITYFDETGDDGYPGSSKRFVLTGVTVHHQEWKEAHEKVLQFRRELKRIYGLPVKIELHTKALATNKRPYKTFQFDASNVCSILREAAKFIASLNIQATNVIIDKDRINKPGYLILDNALTYCVQRIETTIKNTEPSSKFLTISDEGRLGAMRKTVRRIQKIHYVPSDFGGKYRSNIQLLIEDVLSKDSKESFFIQIADYISYFVYLYHLPSDFWHNRLQFDENFVREIIEILTPIFNTKASRKEPHGFVVYPL